MGKNTEIYSKVYSVFATPEWVAENIKTIPANFAGETGATEYVRISILLSDGVVNRKSGTGVLNIDIFSEAGLGMKATNAIADTLDDYLESKTMPANGINIQFGQSSSSPMGPCRDNNALYRTIYSISFNYYGVTT